MKNRVGMLDRIMSKEENEIIVVDIETTGLSPQHDYIIEIGICKLNLDSGKITKLFDKVVRERGVSQSDRNAWIFQNSNLKFEEVINAPLLDRFIPELQDIFDKFPATAYNKRFDFSFLRMSGISIDNELPCPMITATPIMKLERKNQYGNIYNNYEFQYKYPNVEEAWHYYIPNVHYIELHRAYDDAVHEARILFEMYKKEDYVLK
jgi:DNA polymerase-3 subunit epsilon